MRRLGKWIVFLWIIVPFVMISLAMEKAFQSADDPAASTALARQVHDSCSFTFHTTPMLFLGLLLWIFGRRHASRGVS
jgi:hypothetical protein